MVKIKNVRPGILIIADAGLKLTPGESRDVEELTPQTKEALSNGLLAQIDKATEKARDTKPQAKGSTRKSEEKGLGKAGAVKPESTGSAVSESEDSTGRSGEQQKPAQQTLVEVESGDK